MKLYNKTSFYLTQMVERGFEREQVLHGTGLHEDQVSAEEFRLEPDQYRTIVNNILRLTQDPFIGIALGSEFRINSLGVLGYAALSSSSLSQSREIWTKYGMLNESVLVTENKATRGKWFSEIAEKFPLGNLLPFTIEEFVSQTIELASSLTNRRFPILEMRLTYAQPEDLSAYQERFDCPMFFNQPRNLIEYDIDRINDPISLANEQVNELCKWQCQVLVNQLADAELLSNKIRDELVKRPGEFPTLEVMAERLKMGSRTLRRRLVKENVTYQQILDDMRKDLAIQYLEHTSLTPKEIGFLLGYNSVSNFRRAFKSWTGKKLTDFRQKGPSSEQQAS